MEEKTNSQDAASEQRYKQSLQDRLQAMRDKLKTEGDLSVIDHLQQTAESHNKQVGNLQGYDCKKCLNRGDFWNVEKMYLVAIPCECMKIRHTLPHIEASGLKELMKKYTFDAYKTPDDWQKTVKARAIKFADKPCGWWFIGGNSGAGKSHICTAIVGELLQKGIVCKYMLWKTEARRIKAVTNETDEYDKRLEDLITVPVLYIDDFLWVPDYNGKVTDADLTLAREIIDYRVSKNLTTIISSERNLNDIITLCESLGGRINEMCEPENIINISKDLKKNWRLK